MTKYQIDPAGVESVLLKTQGDAEAIGPIVAPLQGWVESAAAGTGGSGAVVPALQAFFQDQSTHLDSINRRVTASLTGAYDATKAYIDGDVEMVGHYQQIAAEQAIAPPAPVAPQHGNIPQ